MRAKEFLSQNLDTFQIIDLSLEPERIEDLTSRGILKVPVVMVGDEYCRGERLEDVAALVGIDYGPPSILPADELVRRFDRVLAVASELAAQMPEELLWQRAISNRDRPVIGLAFHTIDLCPKMLDGYPTKTLAMSTHDQRPDDLDSAAKLAAFGLDARERLADWWAAQRGGFDLDAIWDTYYGERRGHQMLERQVWHPAQHTRQLHDVVVRAGLEPADRLTEDDLDGLPMPAGFWE